jgi:hypothetical protein
MFVVVVNLRQARRVDQYLCQAVNTGQLRRWTGVMLFYTGNHSLWSSSCQQHWFPRLAHIKNAYHRGYCELVTISANCPLPTAVHNVTCNDRYLFACQIATLVAPFPRLTYTTQAKEWQVWTANVKLSHLICGKAVTVTRQTFVKSLERKCLANKPVVGTEWSSTGSGLKPTHTHTHTHTHSEYTS